MTHHLPPLSYSGVIWFLERKNTLTRNKKGEHGIWYCQLHKSHGIQEQEILIEALLSNAVWTSGWMTGQVELGAIL